jgi:hypothetical protein
VTTSILGPNALTTVATAADAISGANATTHQTKLERMINVASDAIEGYCGRLFGRNTGYVETLAPPGGECLILALTPLVSITSAVLDGTALSGHAIEDAAKGFVHLDGGWGGEDYEDEAEGSVTLATIPGTARRVLVVTYSGGYVLPKDATAGPPAVVRTLPYELEHACVQVVAALWRNEGGIPPSEVNAAIGRGFGGIIPDAVIPILAGYRRAS